MGAREHGYWVYVMASGTCGYLYVGMTNDLVRRVEEHRAGKVDGHSRKHAINRLVWFEQHQYVDQAILREKRIKRWHRPWKFRLIEESNPRWADLYGDLVVDRLPHRVEGDPPPNCHPGRSEAEGRDKGSGMKNGDRR